MLFLALVIPSLEFSEEILLHATDGTLLRKPRGRFDTDILIFTDQVTHSVRLSPTTTLVVAQSSRKRVAN